MKIISEMFKENFKEKFLRNLKMPDLIIPQNTSGVN